MRRTHTSLLLSAMLLTGCASGTYAPVVRLGVGPAKAPPSYLVKRGDTLFSIAWTYGMDYRQLARLNHLSQTFQIWPGQHLSLKQRVTKAIKPTPKIKFTPTHWAMKHYRQGWAWPTKGQIIQGFRPGFAGNAGLDFKGHLGQPVLATQAGNVVYSGDGVRGYGNLIIIKHSNDYLSAYAFNEKNLVQVGSRVRKGQQVAVMGRNNAGSAVLHFEIRQDGRPIDPLRFLR